MASRPVIRNATCSCGQLRLKCGGEPDSVSLCHCQDCQRRTGSAFGIAAFFQAEMVEVDGESRRFARSRNDEVDFEFHFCPNCGGTVYWMTTGKPGLVAVAGGAFADPAFPPPQQAVYEQHRHPWLMLDV